MDRQWWDHPLMLETKRLGRVVSINCTERAAGFLLNEWPTERTGQAYEWAKQALLDAVEGRITTEAARSAMIAAAREDGVFVYGE
ncbi:DUF982 domain-containing protein (plasmid) [Rhizobium sp. CB3171]|uniref:DUF982 domain-containing protein n=1 Tax=Rhizobium sp. CB3171 TaxID=3039157 RepID=UPI0024B19DF1|nr:DUF982 domain-containing protein [Rhizobium sp. CB3171]WFU05731.1 DUF982 domain-containing protein [Rhizobium sp. CB3171]